MCMYVYVMIVSVPIEARRVTGPSGTGVIGNFEPPDMGARNQTLVPWKSSKCS